MVDCNLFWDLFFDIDHLFHPDGTNITKAIAPPKINLFSNQFPIRFIRPTTKCQILEFQLSTDLLVTNPLVLKFNLEDYCYDWSQLY